MNWTVPIFIMAGVAALAFAPMFRLSPWVYASEGSNKRFTRIPGQRLYRRGPYVLWSPVRRIVPGLWICTGSKFYLDTSGFYRLWGGRPA